MLSQTSINQMQDINTVVKLIINSHVIDLYNIVVDQDGVDYQQ